MEIHNAVADEPDPDSTETIPLPDIPQARVRVTSIDNLTGGEWDRIGIAIYELAVTGEAELDRDAVLDDFLRARVAYDLPDEGTSEDMVDDINIPQD